MDLILTSPGARRRPVTVPFHVILLYSIRYLKSSQTNPYNYLLGFRMWKFKYPFCYDLKHGCTDPGRKRHLRGKVYKSCLLAEAITVTHRIPHCHDKFCPSKCQPHTRHLTFDQEPPSKSPARPPTERPQPKLGNPSCLPLARLPDATALLPFRTPSQRPRWLLNL